MNTSDESLSAEQIDGLKVKCHPWFPDDQAMASIYDIFARDPKTRGDLRDHYKRGLVGFMRPAKNTRAYAAWLAGAHAAQLRRSPHGAVREAKAALEAVCAEVLSLSSASYLRPATLTAVRDAIAALSLDPAPEGEAARGPGTEQHEYQPDTSQYAGDCAICGHTEAAHRPTPINGAKE